MTAFDGPGPFDGDAVYNYIDQTELAPAEFREAVADAFRAIAEGGAAGQLPPEFLAMAGLSHPPVYVDVDEAVWAWACAELVALALGHEPETPIPTAFEHAASSLPEVAGLASMASEALQVVSDPQRSELASLLEEAENHAALQRIGRLQALLQG